MVSLHGNEHDYVYRHVLQQSHDIVINTLLKYLFAGIKTHRHMEGLLFLRGSSVLASSKFVIPHYRDPVSFPRFIALVTVSMHSLCSLFVGRTHSIR